MIGILIFRDFQILDAAGPISVFEIAGRFAGAASSIRVLAEVPGPVRSSSGVELTARGLRSAGAISTLIVAGGEGVEVAVRSKRTLAFVRSSREMHWILFGARVTSLSRLAASSVAIRSLPRPFVPGW